MKQLSRREFLGLGATALAGLALSQQPAAAQAARAATVPPGEQQPQPLPFAPDSLRGISAEQITWHHDRHYTGYVKNRNEIERELATLDPAARDFDAKRYSGLKRQQTFNVCGQVLHEVYFSGLGGDGQAPRDTALAAALTASFGSVARWQADLTAAATAAGIGWGVTCWEPSAGRLVNYLVELHQLGAVWAAGPLVALDAWEHAYYRDYGPDKARYFAAYFDNLHWGRLEQRFLVVRG